MSASLFGVLEVLPHPIAVWADDALWFANAAAVRRYGDHFEWAFAIGSTPAAGVIGRGPDGRMVEVHLVATEIDGRSARIATLRQLDDAHERAASSELISGILHNVGNVLNSVAVSGARLHDAVQRSRVEMVSRTARMVEAQTDLARFLTEDERGKRLPGFLVQLGTWLESERREIRREVRFLQHSLEHVRAVIATQQRRARSGLEDGCSVGDVVGIALDIMESTFEREGIRVSRELAETPTVELDANQLLQILLNLLDNAVDVLRGVEADRRIDVVLTHGAGRAMISVTDSGPGVSPEVAARLFERGFTTKEDGHGFGLHSSAHAARALGGSLRMQPREVGTGARFVIELPMRGVTRSRDGSASWLMGPLRRGLDTAG